MPTIKISLQGFEQLQQRLIRTENQWNDLHIPFARAALILYGSIKKNFREGGRPRWQGVKRAAGRRGNAPKHRDGELLKDSGRLRSSVGYNGQADIHKEQHTGTTHTLEIGTNVSYAAVHQFGYRGTVNQSVRAHTRRITQAFGRRISPRSVAVNAHSRTIRQNIPPRPFLMMHPEDREDIIKEFQKWFGQSLTGKTS